MEQFLTFGQAIELVREGKLIQRKGWNGKGMFVFMRPEDQLAIGFVIETVKSLPKSVKDYYANYASLSTSSKEENIKFTSYLCMKAADGTIVNGWLASQTDMLAKDWEEFEISSTKQIEKSIE